MFKLFFSPCVFACMALTAFAGHPVVLSSNSNHCFVSPSFHHPTFSYVSPQSHVVHHGSSYVAPIHHQKVATVVEKVVEKAVVAHKEHDKPLLSVIEDMEKRRLDHALLSQYISNFWVNQNVNQNVNVNTQPQQVYPQQVPQQVVPYSVAPQGTTAYSVQSTRIDAFAPPDPTEILSQAMRWSSDANSAATGVVGDTLEAAKVMANSIDKHNQAVASIAAIDADSNRIRAESEGRAQAYAGMAQFAQSLAQVAEASRPSAKVTVEQNSVTPYTVPASPAAPQPQQPAQLITPPAGDVAEAASVASDSFPLYNQYCAKCHSPAEAEEKGAGIAIDVGRGLSFKQFMNIRQTIVSGEMPKGVKEPLDWQTRTDLLSEILQGVKQ